MVPSFGGGCDSCCGGDKPLIVVPSVSLTVSVLEVVPVGVVVATVVIVGVVVVSLTAILLLLLLVGNHVPELEEVDDEAELYKDDKVFFCGCCCELAVTSCCILDADPVVVVVVLAITILLRAYCINSLSFNNCCLVFINSNGFNAVRTTTVQTAPDNANRAYSLALNADAGLVTGNFPTPPNIGSYARYRGDKYDILIDCGIIAILGIE